MSDAVTGSAPGPAPGSATGPASSPARRRNWRTFWWGRIIWALLPTAIFLLLIGMWWLAVVLFRIPVYLLPPPQDVLPRLYAARETLWFHTMVTVQEIVAGFALSVVTAIPLELLIALSPAAKRTLYPLLVFIQLVPKIAIAPLFVVWIGFGPTSKIMLTLLLTFFPLLLASIAGFQILDERYLYLTRSMGASTWQTFRFLRFPSALPVIFGGLKTSATIAATAAIVAEFVGANKGLGYVLLQATGSLDTTYVFAILLVMTVIGLGLNSLVELTEYLMTPWRRRRSSR